MPSIDILFGVNSKPISKNAQIDDEED